MLIDTFSCWCSVSSNCSAVSVFCSTCRLADFAKPSAPLFSVPPFRNHTSCLVTESCKHLYLTLMCFIHPRPGRSAFALAADESVSGLMCVSSWYSPRIYCNCFASVSADTTVQQYWDSAELRLTLLCVRLVVAIVLQAYLGTIPVVLRLVFAQPPESLSLVAVRSLSRASHADGSNFQMSTRERMTRFRRAHWTFVGEVVPPASSFTACCASGRCLARRYNPARQH